MKPPSAAAPHGCAGEAVSATRNEPPGVRPGVFSGRTVCCVLIRSLPVFSPRTASFLPLTIFSRDPLLPRSSAPSSRWPGLGLLVRVCLRVRVRVSHAESRCLCRFKADYDGPADDVPGERCLAQARACAPASSPCCRVAPHSVAVVALALSRQRSVPPTLISAASTPPAAPTARSVLLVTRRAG